MSKITGAALGPFYDNAGRPHDTMPTGEDTGLPLYRAAPAQPIADVSAPTDELIRDMYNWEGGRHFAARLEKIAARAATPVSAHPASIDCDAFWLLFGKCRDAKAGQDYENKRNAFVTYIQSWADSRSAHPAQEQPTSVPATRLKPIEVEDGRTYIPLPGGWEVQTKGKGSTFRICLVRGGKADSHERWIVTDERLHAPLTDMAMAMRSASPAPTSSESTAGQTELIKAADAVVERWHSKDWKQPHTRDFIDRLAAAVGAAKQGESRASSPTTL